MLCVDARRRKRHGRYSPQSSLVGSSGIPGSFCQLMLGSPARGALGHGKATKYKNEWALSAFREGACHAEQHAVNAAWTIGWETDSTVCGVDVSHVSKTWDLGRNNMCPLFSDSQDEASFG